MLHMSISSYEIIAVGAHGKLNDFYRPKSHITADYGICEEPDTLICLNFKKSKYNLRKLDPENVTFCINTHVTEEIGHIDMRRAQVRHRRHSIFHS